MQFLLTILGTRGSMATGGPAFSEFGGDTSCYLVDSGKQHAAGFETHHRSGRQVGYSNERFADELFRLVVGVDTREDCALGAGAVVQRELQQFLGFGHRLAGQDLHRPEIGLGESLKVHVVLEQRFDLYVGEVDLLFGGSRLRRFLRGLAGFLRGAGVAGTFEIGGNFHCLFALLYTLGLHGRESICRSDVTRHNSLFPAFSGIISKGQKP